MQVQIRNKILLHRKSILSFSIFHCYCVLQSLIANTILYRLAFQNILRKAFKKSYGVMGRRVSSNTIMTRELQCLRKGSPPLCVDRWRSNHAAFHAGSCEPSADAISRRFLVGDTNNAISMQGVHAYFRGGYEGGRR